MKVGETKLVCIVAFLGVIECSGDPIDGEVPKLNQVYTYDGTNPYATGYYLKELNYIDLINNERASFSKKKLVPLDEFLESVSIAELVEKSELVTI